MLQIIPLTAIHSKAVLAIYEEGIATGNATFQNTVPSWEEWDKAHAAKPRLVALDENQVIGWAAITPVSGRCVYAGIWRDTVLLERRSKKFGNA